MPALPNDIRKRAFTFTRHFAVIHAIECDNDELVDVGSVRKAAVRAVERKISDLLESQLSMPLLPVWCLGQAASFDWLPERIRGTIGTDGKRGWGLWPVSPRVVVLSLCPRLPVERVIIHELAHASLDLLSGFFSYPLALREGYACLCERGFAANQAGPNNWGRGSGPHGFLAQEQVVPIEELMLRGYPGFIGTPELTVFTRAAYWLIGYLTHIGRECPRVRRILAELRKERVATPAGVLRWLEDASGKSLEHMEKDFREFCTSPCHPGHHRRS
jgi:hypothetical protein